MSAGVAVQLERAHPPRVLAIAASAPALLDSSGLGDLLDVLDTLPHLSPPTARAASVEHALERLTRAEADVALLMTSTLALAAAAVEALHAAAPALPIVVLSLEHDLHTAHQLVRSGAHDVLTLEDSPPEALARVLSFAHERRGYLADLSERVKEQQLISSAARLLTDLDVELGETLERLVELIPSGFVRPELAVARVTCEHGMQSYTASTRRFATATRRLSADLEFADDGRLLLEVGYPESVQGNGLEFLADEQGLLDTLASMLRNHVQRRMATEEAVTLRAELERRSQVQQLLLDVYSRYLSGSTEDAAGMVLDAAIESVNAAAFGSVLVRTDSGSFRFAAVRGYDEAALAQVEIPEHLVLFGRYEGDSTYLIVRDIESVNERVRRDHPELERLAAATSEVAAKEALLAPVAVEGTLVAAISVEHTDPGRSFTSEDGELLLLFAQGIGSLLRRATAEARADVMASAVEAAGDGLAIIDLPADGGDPKVWHANTSFLDLLEVSAGELDAWRPENALGSSHARRVAAAVQKVAIGGDPATLQVPLQLPDGRLRHLEANFTRLASGALDARDAHAAHGARAARGAHDARGARAARLLVAIRDVSERIRHTLELERLNLDLAARLDETNTLEAIDTAIATGKEARTTLEAVLAEVAHRPGLAALNLLVVDETTGELRHAASTPEASSLGLHGRGLERDDPALRVRATRAPWPVGAGSLYVAWPLLMHDSVVGVLEGSLEPGFLPDEEWHRFMLVVSAQVAIAVEHVGMIERLRDSARAYAALAEFSGAIEELDEPEALIDLGVRTLSREFGMDRAAHFVREGDRLIARRRWGHLPEEARPLVERPQQVGRGALGMAVETGEAVFVPEYGSWPHAEEGMAEIGFRSILALPVRSEGEVQSVIGLGSYGHQALLNDDQITIARAFVRRLERALERVAHQRQMERIREDAFRALGLALEYRDYETKGHTDRVVALARRLGQRLGLEEHELEALTWGAYLHDLGKIAIPDHILRKPGRLTSDEFALVKRHAVNGFEMSKDLAFLPSATREVIRSHHERWDGQGYPDGLSGRTIPYLARLFALVDVYDALVSERPYKRAWTHAEAVAELAAQSGRQFDPELTTTMLTLLAEDPKR